MRTAHHHHTVVPMPSTPVVIPASFRRPPDADGAGTGHQHRWVLTAVFAVGQQDVDQCVAAWMNGATPPGLAMDYDTLLDTVGPICLKCNQPLTPETAALPCPVVLIPVLGNTRG